MTQLAEGRFDEGSSGMYSCTLRDEIGDPIALSAVSTLSAKVADQDTATVLMADTDVKSGLHATSGAFSMTLPAAATAIVTATKRREIHVLRLAMVLVNGKTRNWERQIYVTNLQLAG